MNPQWALKPKPKPADTHYLRGKVTKKGGMMTILRKIWHNAHADHSHPHTQENARRLRQIQRGIIKVNS